jgi:hypothetical protein
VKVNSLNFKEFSSLILILVAPLFVIEFLHRIMDVFEDYFGECNETSIKNNYVIVYEVKKNNFFLSNQIVFYLI